MISDLDELYNKARAEIFPNHDDGSGDDHIFKFDFTFALLAFCSEVNVVHSLKDELFIKWGLEATALLYDSENMCQREIYDWLGNEFNVTQEE